MACFMEYWNRHMDLLRLIFCLMKKNSAFWENWRWIMVVIWQKKEIFRKRLPGRSVWWKETKLHWNITILHAVRMKCSDRFTRDTVKPVRADVNWILMIWSCIVMSFLCSEKIFWKHGRRNFSIFLWMNFRISTNCNMILYACWQSHRIICLSLEMMISRFIIFVVQGLKLCWILPEIIRMRKQLHWMWIIDAVDRSFQQRCTWSEKIKNVFPKSFPHRIR